ncbi:MAG TPA: prolipoprotein diacylglyceryl transferase [Clostridia bacterium]|nr:prolipoprotein diacylglyceryl transferase [Clostridia bacterium]
MDKTVVFFKAFEDGITVNSTLAEFSLFGIDFSIKWYGMIIALGFTLAVLFGGRMAHKWKMDLDKMIDVLIFGTVFGIIGARLYYCIFEWSYYSNNLTDIFKIWEGGLAIYGGLIGGLIAAYVTCRVRKLNFLNLLDLGAMSFLIGQGIGRWGNFTNQEAFGTNTELPWGMWSPKTAQYITQHQSIFAAKGLSVEAGTYAEKAYVHPTFLYESLWCLLGFLVIYLICKKFRKFSGQLFLCYGIWYGMGRMVIEGFRTDSLYVGNSIIRVSQLLSAVIVVISLVALIVLLNKYKKNPKPIEGIDYFPDENDADKTSVEVDVALGNEENEAMETVQIINGQINGENDDAEVSENGKDN